METEREQQDEQSGPEIPVIRSNTPRPFSFDGLVAQHGKDGWQHITAQVTDEVLSAFPQEAPVAPPVPEEVEEQGDEVQTAPIKELSEATPLPLPPTMANADAAASEFVWLFEYGLEMDNAILNSPDRLHNLALLYGPAVLKGYELAFAVVESLQQKVVATVAPLATPGAEVWGIVYRIPRRLLEQENGESSELDRVHAAVPPTAVFERVEVVVSEAYRGRELPCITYIARHDQHSQYTRHIQQQPVSLVSDAAYLQHLLEIARKQALPADYIQALALSIASNVTTNSTPVPATEQNTEPLPVLANRQEQQDSSRPVSSAEPIQPIETIQRTQSSQTVSPSRSRNVGLALFASYLGVLLLLALALAVMQGSGIFATVFTASFTPLNVPWYVLLYGLIGGNISCLVTLGRQYGQHRQHGRHGQYGQVIAGLPDFVIIVWCIRPFVGIVLAMLVYLLFNAGLFVPSGNAEQHMMLFSLLAVVAGFGERLLFTKQVA